MPENKQKPKVYKDKKEFDKANQAYNDSLKLFNSYKDVKNKLKTKKYTNSETYNSDWANSLRSFLGSDDVNKYIDKKGVKKFKNDFYSIDDLDRGVINTEIPPQLFHTKIKPIGKEAYQDSNSYLGNAPSNYITSIPGVSADRKQIFNYSNVKPTTKPIYQPDEQVKITKSIPQDKPQNPPKGYNKKFPPIYVTDPKDSRIGFYTEAGNQYLYKAPEIQRAVKPKLEAIKPIGYKPMNTFIEPKLVGGIQPLVEMPKSTTVIQNYTGAKYLEKMKKPTGYVNQGDKQGIQEFQNGGQLGSTLGSIGGMALGSIIAPGIGTTIGGMLGGKAGNFVQNQFENGGKLIHAKGLEHSEGGIQLSNNNEIENGETVINDFVFSNNLLYNKKQTFADKSKSIDKKYFRDNDKIDAMGKKLELEQLANQQENMKKSMIMSELSSKYINGGKLKKKYIWGGGINPNHPMSEDRATIELRKKYEGLVPMTPIGISTNLNSESAGKVLELAGKIQEVPLITSNITDPKTMDVFSNKPNYGNILPQLAGDAFNITQGLKGGDDVNFQRINPYLASPKSAIASMNNATSTSFNSAKNAIRNNATSSGEYLAQMNSLAGAESLKRGFGVAGIKAEYDKINTGIMNQTSSQNAGTQMQEADARQRETDSARSAVSKGLSDMGSKIGSINNEKSARNNQKDLVSLMSKNGYKLTRDANGELGFEKNGTYVPYEIAIGSVLQPQTKV